MNKGELVAKIGELGDMSKANAEQALESVINAIKDGLESDEKVMIAGFGSFLIKGRNARTARNVKTGETINVPAKNAVTFKPSAQLKEWAN